MRRRRARVGWARRALAVMAAAAARGATRARATSAGGSTSCVEAGGTAIFVGYSENAPDAVFPSPDGYCTAGGGRGVGCCAGSACRACVPKQNTDTVNGKTVTQSFYECVCEPCPKGQVQPKTAQKTCVACPRGWYNDVTGAATCKPCPVGTFSSQVGNMLGCSVCGPGTSGKSSREDYDAATSVNYAAPPEGSPGATFDPTLGATSCADCPAGTFGGGAGEACAPCPPGYYSPAKSTSCSPCPVGTYSTEPGATSASTCVPCGAGESNDAPGSTACWRVCPSTVLTCDAAEKRPQGEYDAIEAATARPFVQESSDGIDAFKRERCRKGCETLRARCRSACDERSFDFWCDSRDEPNRNDCDAFAPPPPPPAPSPPPTTSPPPLSPPPLAPPTPPDVAPPT